MPKNKIIFFDIGGVLVNVDSAKSIDRVAKKLGVGKECITEAMTQDFLDQYETGRITTDEFYSNFLEDCRCNGAMDLESFKKYWMDVFTPKQTMIDLLKEIAQHNDVWLLSNTNEFHYQLLQQQFDFMELIKGAIYSYHVGFMKPDPVIYHIALTESHTPSGDAIFIDDLMPNVLAAQKEGIDAIHYTSDIKARLDLSTRLTYLEKRK